MKWQPKFSILLLSLTVTVHLFSQELYVFSEPASNMPAHSIGFNVTARYPVSRSNNYFKERYIAEIMFGLNKNMMLHISGTASNYFSIKVKPESYKGYLKYRLFSNDQVHGHFRLSTFIAASYTQDPFIYHEATLSGDNSGAEAGLIGTKLLNRFAVSGTMSYMRVFANVGQHLNHAGHSLNMLNYSLSGGYLLLPRTYTDFKQTNLNLYLEILGSKGLDVGHYAVDIAPAVQLIFNSNLKLNLGIKLQAIGNMTRVGETTYQAGIEYTLLNVLKRKKYEARN